MKGICFDIEGQYAHFRKFYTNSSSLSYSIPPRTTIEGLIAGILGYERDEYYLRLSSEKLCVSVKKNRPTRSMTQTLNYIKATSSLQLIAPNEHTQIPFEIITGMDENKVSYRIYIASKEDFMDELSERMQRGKFVYPPSLGTVFFQGDIINVQIGEILPQQKEGFTKIHSIVPIKAIKNIKFNEYQLLKEKMPRDFHENRIPKSAQTYLFDQRGLPLDIETESYFTFTTDMGKENILFM